ncbi:MAG: Leg1-related protein [Ilumatobacter sp.]
MQLDVSSLPIADAWAEPDLGSRFDPFRFDHRMAAYRQLIDVTNTADRFGADNRDNPLWGLPFQHQWQNDSGRLSSPPGEQGVSDIDPDAAWGFGNYTLAVIPWLGAVAAGLVDEREIAPPPKPSRFSYVSNGVVPADLQRSLDAWGAYFDATMDLTRSNDEVRERMWHAHKQSLDAAASVISTISTTTESDLELSFLRGWCRMVDYLWAANWRTDFDFIVENGLDVLPDQPLTEASIAQLDPEIRSTLDNVLDLSRKSDRRVRFELRMWKRAMRTDEAKRDVADLLDAVFNPTPQNRSDRKRLLRFMAAR